MVHSVQAPEINPYPDSQVAAVVKSPVQVFIPAAEEVQSEHPVAPVTGPFPSSQVVQMVAEQTKQPSPQSVQTLEAKY